jgi:carbonic anhydrase
MQVPGVRSTASQGTVSTNGRDGRHEVEGLSRRRFMAVAVAGVAGFATSRTALAKEPPKPQNVLSPDAALERLMAGNAR